MSRNLCAKTVKRENAYEVWKSPCTCSLDVPHDLLTACPSRWTWYVLKKWQADDDKMDARWFCDVVTPIVPHGEMGDVYVHEVKDQATRVLPLV